jgi:hypothetical protein
MSESGVLIRVESLGEKYTLHYEQSERGPRNCSFFSSYHIFLKPVLNLVCSVESEATSPTQSVAAFCQ